MITTTSTIFDGRVSLTCCGRRVLSPAWSYFQNDKTTLWYRTAVDPLGERAVSYCEGLRFDSSNKWVKMCVSPSGRDDHSTLISLWVCIWAHTHISCVWYSVGQYMKHFSFFKIEKLIRTQLFDPEWDFYILR